MSNNGSTEASQGLELVCHDPTTEAARWMQYYHDAGDGSASGLAFYFFS